MITTIPIPSQAPMFGDSPNINFSTYAQPLVGHMYGQVLPMRTILLPDFSGTPAGSIFTSAYLWLDVVMKNQIRVPEIVRVYRVLKPVVCSQATWNIYATGTNWDTVGCGNSTTDYGVELGNVLSTVPTQAPMTITLDPAQLNKYLSGEFANNGIVLKFDIEHDDVFAFNSMNSAYPNVWPRIYVTMTEPKSFFFIKKNWRTNVKNYRS